MTGDQLKTWRSEHNLTLADAERIFGIDPATFTRWLRRGDRPIPGTGARIALIFEKDPDIVIDAIELVEAAELRVLQVEADELRVLQDAIDAQNAIG